MAKLLAMLIIIPLYSFSVVTLNLSMNCDEMSLRTFNEIRNTILRLLPKQVVLAESGPCDFEMEFRLRYDPEKEIYVGEWLEGSEVVARYTYDPKGYKYYRDFVMECASYPLEKVSFHLFAKGEFEDFIRLTYHPALEEYCDFSKDYLVFVSDRIGGNRDIFLLDRKSGKLLTITVRGSSEYFPRISPDGKQLLFQGSIHGNWNVYLIPFSPGSPSSVRRISAGPFAAYNPNWFDANRVVYVQENQRSNHIVLKDLKTMKEQVYNLPFDWVFTPVRYKNGLIFVGFKDADSGIYFLSLEDGKIETIENSPYNEFDPDVFEDYLVFSSNRDGIFRIYAKDLRDGKTWCLTKDIPYDAFYPVFSEDGTLVAFSVYERDREPDVWVVRFFTPEA